MKIRWAVNLYPGHTTYTPYAVGIQPHYQEWSTRADLLHIYCTFCKSIEDGLRIELILLQYEEQLASFWTPSNAVPVKADYLPIHKSYISCSTIIIILQRNSTKSWGCWNETKLQNPKILGLFIQLRFDKKANYPPTIICFKAAYRLQETYGYCRIPALLMSTTSFYLDH